MSWIGTQFLDIVVFLSTPGRGPGGTAFLVDVPAQDSDGMRYLVTAKHNLEEAQSDTVLVRFNEGSGVSEIRTSRDDWFTHDSADVAALAITGGLGRIQKALGKALPIEGFVDESLSFPTMHLPNQAQVVGGKSIQVGDEIFFTGLFSESAGSEQNLPVARFGRLSRIANEPIALRRWGGTNIAKITAHLVESLSLGGASGSPVFARRQTIETLVTSDGRPRGVRLDYVVGLLGLVTGHWDLQRKAVVTSSPKMCSWIPDADGTELDVRISLNSGIAIVTPASVITELLCREDVVEQRS